MKGAFPSKMILEHVTCQTSMYVATRLRDDQDARQDETNCKGFDMMHRGVLFPGICIVKIRI